MPAIVSHHLPAMGFLADGMVLLLAIIGLGFVIAIHELGHFLFAKWAGVRVHEFVIGFGPRVWAKTVGETEYSIRLLPVGGYVYMQDQEPEEGGDGRSFTSVNHGWQILILFGGVLFNLISSFLILLVLAWVGAPSMPPIVGGIQEETPVAAGTFETSTAVQLGLRPGDIIREIDGNRTNEYEDVVLRMVDRGNEPIEIVIERDGELLTLPGPGAEAVVPVYDQLNGRRTLGIEAAIGRTLHDARGPGAEDLPQGWTLTAIDGESIPGITGQTLIRALKRKIGDSVELTFSADPEASDSDTQTTTITLADVFTHAGGELDAMALGLPVVIAAVTPGLSAAEQGVSSGDTIVAVNGQAITSTGHLVRHIQAAVANQQPVELVVQRPRQVAAWWALPAEMLAAVERRVVDGLQVPLAATAFGHQPHAWQELSFQLEPRFSDVLGRVLIGINMSSLRAGPIAVLPPPFTGDTNPLAAAGITPGSALIATKPIPDDDRITVRTISHAQTVELQANQAAWIGLRRFHEPSAISKLFGARSRPAALRQLIGSEILRLEGGFLTLAPVTTADRGEPIVIDLAKLDAAAADLLTELQPGDVVLDQREVEDGGRLVVIRASGADAVSSVVGVSPITPGTALGFSIMRTTVELDGWLDAFAWAGHKTADIVGTTMRVIPRFFQSSEAGGIDHSKNLHGPIGIFRALKVTAEDGLATYLRLLAVLGLNLFLINLLPLPIADGGRLLFVFIEVIARRPLPAKAQNVINGFGVLLVVSLMVYVIGLDLLRVFGLH